MTERLKAEIRMLKAKYSRLEKEHKKLLQVVEKQHEQIETLKRRNYAHRG